MDIDPLPQTQSSNNSSLPLIEKYRPKSLTEIVSHKDILQTINSFLLKKNFPHLLLHGPPGTGKTSCAQSIVNTIFSSALNTKQMVLELNASDERGINTVRDQIKSFCSSNSIGISMKQFKIIILDEADMMTAIAQAALRRIMEKYHKNCRFILICNQVNKIIPAIQSRCLRFRFAPLKFEEGVRKIEEICRKEGYIIEDEDEIRKEDALKSLFLISKGDMRRVLNTIESAGLSYGNRILKDNIYELCSKPSDEFMSNFIKTCLSVNLPSAIEFFLSHKQEKGFSISDFIDQLLFLVVNKVEFKIHELYKKIEFLNRLQKIDYASCIGSSDRLLASNIVMTIKEVYSK